jgi:hypothetical protein
MAETSDKEIQQDTLLRIFGQMQEMLTKFSELNQIVIQHTVILGQFASTWCPDIERVADEHADDIDALKAGQEHIGKNIAALRKEIQLLRGKK